MSIVGEVILNVTIEMLFTKLASEVLPLFGRQEKIRADLLDWQRKLKKIKAVLDDAEEKQLTDERVKDWLGELKNLAYDVEDILDEFATDSLKRNLQHQSQPSTSKFKNLIPTCCTKFSPQSVKSDSKMRRQIDEITCRLQSIETDKNLLDLNENSGERKSKKVRQRQPTTSLVNEDNVFGREKEKKEILELLLRDDLIAHGFSVIPIVAMEGMGKTTLAQLVYNDKTVERHFDLKIWVCVSEDFDVVKVTKTMLRSVDDKAGDDDDLNRLQEKLRSKLREKKFFLVLDDLWNEDRNDWELLSLPFVVGAAGSKIVVTTRIKDVASNVGTVTPYEMNKLSDDDCLLVFTQHSLGTRDFSMHQHLKAIGENIVKKCNGLPLAAKTLGGILYRKYNRSDWQKVENSKIWELPEEKCGIMKALAVSYHYLPVHLKRCFSYCSLLPKDYEFRTKEIVLLWMAEGLLEPDSNKQKMEESGLLYFQELQSRSFFQPSSMDMSRFVMHDLINDLAEWAAGKIHRRMEDTLETNTQREFSKNLRHLSYIIGKYDGIKRFEAISDAEHLRTFLPIAMRDTTNYLSPSVVQMLPKLQRLRVLFLHGYLISEVPDSIGDLKHLRHLDLSSTGIKILPNSINALYNLHTLLLQNCWSLKKLCADMGNLIKLRHLNNDNAYWLEEMPKGIGKLTCLQTLCHFAVGQSNESGLKELKSLNNLRGKLKISRLENVTNVDDAKKTELNGKRDIIELSLEWSHSSGNQREPTTETDVLDMLRPNENVKELTIKNYGGTNFPIWLRDSTLLNVVILRFEGCNLCTSLPTVGQLPFLKHLFIVRMPAVRSVGREFYGSSAEVIFPSLETLYFEDMREWKDWICDGFGEEVEVFPQLKVLSLQRCSNLVGKLPARLRSLERLAIRRCEQLPLLIPSSPSLCILKIGRCKEVVWRNTINPSSSNSLVSNDMSEQVLATGNNNELTYIWRNGTELLQNISSLQTLQIGHYQKLLCLVAEEETNEQQQQGLQCKLHYLQLKDFQSLVKLPHALLSLRSLKEILLVDCDSLEYSFPEAWMHNTNISLESLIIECCNSLTYIAKVRLPPSLKRIKINDCKNLRSLIDEDQVSVMELEEDINGGYSRYTSVLEELDIYECPSLTSLFSKSGLPSTLQKVRVVKCSKLALLSSREKLPKALQYLHLYQCSELESIAERLDDNTSLETIRVENCQNLRILPNNLHKASQLRHFGLSGCPNLVSFPEEGLLACTKLTYLSISDCQKLKALPKVTSLQGLTIQGCPRIESFPKDIIRIDLLGSLLIDYEILDKPLCEWRLHRFTSLTILSLYGSECLDLVSFPPEDAEMALPDSLKHLTIGSFRKLERLSSIIENLKKLESLYFSFCPKLEYFPEKGLPPSLSQLTIGGFRRPMILLD
ncbi:Disease resistance protein [Melia azedarach]|uniref:Disease resistance protein n=1 Tax=Melia azedarach TaxID=155640 RepID=A0ACC1YMF5_MELAZ|nr:Disease resistance protein [Melia azedarach]